MIRMKTSIKRMCAVGLVTLSLACATGCTAAADTTVPTVSEEQAKSELNQYGNNNGGYNNVQEAEAQYSNDAVSVTVKNGKEHVVSLEDAKKACEDEIAALTEAHSEEVKLLNAQIETLTQQINDMTEANAKEVEALKKASEEMKADYEEAAKDAAKAYDEAIEKLNEQIEEFEKELEALKEAE